MPPKKYNLRDRKNKPPAKEQTNPEETIPKDTSPTPKDVTPQSKETPEKSVNKTSSDAPSKEPEPSNPIGDLKRKDNEEAVEDIGRKRQKNDHMDPKNDHKDPKDPKNGNLRDPKDPKDPKNDHKDPKNGNLRDPKNDHKDPKNGNLRDPKDDHRDPKNGNLRDPNNPKNRYYLRNPRNHRNPNKPPQNSCNPNKPPAPDQTMFLYEGKLLTPEQMLDMMTKLLLEEAINDLQRSKKNKNVNTSSDDDFIVDDSENSEDFDDDYGDYDDYDDEDDEYCDDENCDCRDCDWSDSDFKDSEDSDSDSDSDTDEFDKLMRTKRQKRSENSGRSKLTGHSGRSELSGHSGRSTKLRITLPKKPVDINQKIQTLDDLINLGKTFQIKSDEKYAVNMNCIIRLVPVLEKLQALVGMQEIKQSIANHLIFLLSGLNDKQHMNHAVIYGPPGSGKTSLALILSKIYEALGYSNGKFKIVKRSDLVAGYLGQTTLKTQQAINSVLGGVLFIDEAYSLGDKEGRDSFAKEMIDCLNQNLSEQRSKFICIIAGYRKELEKCFFSANPGLKRRFPFQYTVGKYTNVELAQIFKSMIESQDWKLDPDLNIDAIAQAIKKDWPAFKNQGGDIETLVLHCKMAHAKRIFGCHEVNAKAINTADFQEALKSFLFHKKVSIDSGGKELSSEELKKVAKTYINQMKTDKII